MALKIEVGGWDFSPGQLMTTREVADAFRVCPGSVHRWSDLGRLVCVRTPGGERRFSRQQINALLRGETAAAK